MDRDRILVAIDGIPYIAISGFIAILLYLFDWIISAALFSILTLFIIWFFRNPERRAPGGNNVVISPADGKIINISEGVEGRVLKKKMIKISIFMNIFNVHVNRIPCSGKIAGIFYNHGKFISANRDKASLENEQNAVLLETAAGEKILFVQIAGMIARRIVCWLKKGDTVEKGQRFGLIKFGSRVDVYLPHGVDVKVSMGEKVKAGESVLAFLKR